MSEKKLLVILPTYNEAPNIGQLIRRIFGINRNYHVVVVDDNSPDKTGDIAENLKKEYANLSVIHRSGKLGLGTAYEAGFAMGLAEQFPFILTMDSDFSHDPVYIPQILELAQQQDCDLVIGSRYVPGGGIENWPWHRKFLSRLANTTAHAILSLEAKDCTAGFRCYSYRFLRGIDFSKIKSEGYSYLTEILYLCQRKRGKIREVPIIFTDRKRGASKISKKEIFKGVSTVFRLRKDKIT